MRIGFVLKTPCVSCMMTGDDNISRPIVYHRSLREPNIVERSLLEILRNNIASVEDEIEAAEVEKKECGQDLLKKYLLSAWPFF